MSKILTAAGARPAVILGVLATLAACRDKPVPPVPPAPTPRVAVASQPAVGINTQQPEGGSEGEEVEVTQSLKGNDFTLEVQVNGNDAYRNLDISMADGKQVRQLRSITGKTGELASTTFAPGDTFEFRELIPGESRQQILCKGNELLSRGAGTLGTYTLYRIEGDRLQEVLSLVTERLVEDGNGFEPQTLRATVEEAKRDGQPLIVYRVKTGKLPERTIEFRWNGKLFEDASGEYAKIASEYIP